MKKKDLISALKEISILPMRTRSDGFRALQIANAALADKKVVETLLGKKVAINAPFARGKEGIVVYIIPSGEAINVDQAKLWFPNLFLQNAHQKDRVLRTYPFERCIVIRKHVSIPDENVFCIYETRFLTKLS